MKLLRELKQQVAGFFLKVLVLDSDDSKPVQLLKTTGFAGEVIEGVERAQPYGLSTRPPAQAEGVVTFLQGERGHGVAVAVDSQQSRPKGLDKGEVVLYSDQGQEIKLDKDGNIVIKGSKIIVESGDVNIGGSTLAPTAGVVTGECLCAFTGTPHPQFSGVVRAKK